MNPAYCQCKLIHIVVFVIMTLAVLGLTASPGLAYLETWEYQVTYELVEQSTPKLSRDSLGNYVVFADYSKSAEGNVYQSDIYYQRLQDDGTAIGSRVAVGATTADERQPDAYGDYIVYTRFESTANSTGRIKLYQISTGTYSDLDTAGDSCCPKIHGDVVVWLKATPTGNLLMMYRLSWGETKSPKIIAGPAANPKDVEIGDRFVVWTQLAYGQGDVAAYDLSTGASLTVAGDPALEEGMPATSGPWVVYQISSGDNPAATSLRVRNLDSGEERLIADNGANNAFPRIDGDLISFESNVSGNWQVYIYHLNYGGCTYQVTYRPEDQRFNDIKGNLVAYVDNRNNANGRDNNDVFVSSLRIISTPPVLVAGPDQVVTSIGTTVQLDGTRSYFPDGFRITGYQWLLGPPPGSTAELSDPPFCDTHFRSRCPRHL